jgi:hypothetical protein
MVKMRVKLHKAKESLLWLECTVSEAENNIYPLLSGELIEISKNFITEVMRKWKVGDEEDYRQHPHDIYSKETIKYPACFNVDINLSRIEPAPAYLPYSHMWNGYCPYSLTDEICFDDFEDLKRRYIVSDSIEVHAMKERRITSIEIRNSANGPFSAEEIISERLVVYRTGKIKHNLFNGLSDLPVEKYEYKVDRSKIEEFFEQLSSTIKIQDWGKDYSVEVCDGWNWECKIRHSDNTIKKVIGTVEPPPRGKQLRDRVLKLTNFIVKPWLL